MALSKLQIKINFKSSTSLMKKEHCFFENSQLSPLCYSAKSDMKIKMRTEHWWNDTERGKEK
jgi:hypothetical protein